MTYLSSRFSFSFAIWFVCLFVHFLPSNGRILALNMMNTWSESQTKHRLRVRCILCPFELSLRRVFSVPYRSCSFLKYQYFQISIKLESKKSHRFASSKHAALSCTHAANRDFLTVNFNCKLGFSIRASY